MGHRGKYNISLRLRLAQFLLLNFCLSSYLLGIHSTMSEEEAANQQPQSVVETPVASAKRERSPAAAAAADGGGEEDAFNASSTTSASKKPKFEKKNRKDFKPKSPYPGRNKRDDRPPLTAEEKAAKDEEREKLREQRRLADEERMANIDPEDRRLPKRRCALLIGYATLSQCPRLRRIKLTRWIQLLRFWLLWYADVRLSLRRSLQPDIRVDDPCSQAAAETIEGEVFKALVKAGAVSEDNSVDHRKVDVQRAARTDSGVHAAGNWFVYFQLSIAKTAR